MSSEATRSSATGVPSPTAGASASTAISMWQRSKGRSLYAVSAATQKRVVAASLADPPAYWSKVASALSWVEAPVFSFSDSSPVISTSGKISLYDNLVSRHVADQSARNQPALIYDSPNALSAKGDGSKGVKLTFSYLQLDSQVRAIAKLLLSLDVKPGDVVLLYMPMVPEAVFTMLASVRCGAVHAVVFGGFAPAELAKRINDSKPKVVFYASCGLEPTRLIPYAPALEEALRLSDYKPAHIVLLNRPELKLEPAPKGHIPFPTLFTYSEHELKNIPGAVALRSDSPLYLLYTSGSTGTPKGVVRDVGGHAVSLKHVMDNVMGVKKGDVFFAASDIGWVVGHTFIVYGPLIQGCTTILYEGKPVMGNDGAGAFWRLIQEYKINALYTAPTAIRAIRKEDPEGKLIAKFNIKSLRDVFLAGERCDPDTAVFFTQKLGVSLRDNFWQTETGSPITGACVMRTGHLTLPKMGSCGPAVPGYDIRVLVAPKHHSDFEKSHQNPAGSEYAPEAPAPPSRWVEASPGEVGALVLKLPLPPGCFPTLWNNHEGYLRSYFERFPGYYDLTDQGFVDSDGYVTVLGRSDDVLNVAGHRLSSGGMEEVVSGHKQVAECAVVGVSDALKGEKPVGFVVLKSGSSQNAGSVERELIAAVRAKVGAVACFDRVIFVKRLPKTRSGKILRRSLRSIANGEKYSIPATIEDPECLHEIAKILRNTSKL
ncbi:hypothetical protein HDU82_000486 [Entophlyctis luteolus]|nr:hypothetical protein HDU82_000486 [Entophlyctis luteolus]